MIELPRSSSSSTPTRLMVLGVGSAGCNMLDRLVLDGLEGAELIAINTDVQSLAGCVAPRQIHIGESITRGLGTGGDPELGHASARESAEEIRAALAGATLVFLLGGLGGGTSSGALPALAQVAREEGAHVVVVATLPFGFEGRRRRTQAEESLAALRASADLLVCFENDRMPEIVAARAGVREAFAAVDVTMSQCVRSLGALAQRRGLLHAGFDEVAALFRQSDQRALFGTAVASGDNRAHEVAEALLRSPLLEHERQMREISSAMIHVAGGPDLTLHEVETFMGELKKHLLADTDLFFGLAVDEAMAGQMSVTVLGAVGQKAAMVVPVPVRPTPEEKVEAVEAPGLTEEEAPAATARQEPEPEAQPAPVRPRMRPLFAPLQNLRRPAAAAEEESASPLSPVKTRESRHEQMQFEPVNRGRFEKSEPTIIDGQDLDVPTFLRRNLRAK